MPAAFGSNEVLLGRRVFLDTFSSLKIVFDAKPGGWGLAPLPVVLSPVNSAGKAAIGSIIYCSQRAQLMHRVLV